MECESDTAFTRLEDLLEVGELCVDGRLALNLRREMECDPCSCDYSMGTKLANMQKELAHLYNLVSSLQPISCTGTPFHGTYKQFTLATKSEGLLAWYVHLLRRDMMSNQDGSK